MNTGVLRYNKMRILDFNRSTASASREENNLTTLICTSTIINLGS